MTTNFFDYAEKHKLALFPIPAGFKDDPGWKDGTGIIKYFSRDWSRLKVQWQHWHFDHKCNFGLIAGPSFLIIIDIDVGEVGRETAWNYWCEWCRAHGIDPADYPPQFQSAKQGWHIAFVVNDHDDYARLRQIPLIGAIEGVCKKAIIDSRIGNGYVIAAGSTFQDKPYVQLLDNPPYVAPDALVAAFGRLPRTSASSKPGQYEFEQVRALYEWMAEHDAFTEYHDWVQAGMIARAEFEDRGLELWQITNDGTASASDEERKWRSFRRDGVTLASLMKRAHDMGWKGNIRKTAAAIFEGVTLAPGLGPCPVPGAPLASSLPAPPMPRNSMIIGPGGERLPIDSEDSLALDFADQHVSELRHCEEWGKWLRWRDTLWQTDRTSGAYNLVRQHLRKLGGGMHPQDARKILSGKTVAAVERMAKTDPRIATEAAVWDADPWLLNTPRGAVDLRTCVIREARRADHMTKSTAVAPGGECPTWKTFLHRSLAGDADLISFVQRLLGYSLTGDTSEQALFFLYGQGGNGKGVLLNTVRDILADYARTAPMATFTDSANAGDRHPTDLAGLRGARFVMASETEKGRKWAEAKIKSLTGGDPIAARFMGRDFFEYVPTFKLVIAGNHKPRLSTVDEAIRRRMHMIPFTVQIPEHERDKTLPEKLRAEWGGILAWMIEGCLAWQRNGLQAPAAVRVATDEYLSSQDALATWMDERCEKAPDAWAGRTGLFASWSAWALGAREPIGNANEFYQALSNKGFPEHKRDGTRGFKGIRLRQFGDMPLPGIPQR
ncbi:bifunctional DNA primase/polymerase [Bradyrhizobium jicamae]|uniref:Bifunctional DNA primase/polymerase n=1 Tax=Bradyrhizobium jicamae TaxID=280332 RepID=A0ABS5FC85_9BRAD|nr:phage/plasmid primase, P4 family [Bradyrhizobium jicamae]MBR0793966.1 bifunctional DNA primase/polymerase [Bradyrhizobium jicamae]